MTADRFYRSLDAALALTPDCPHPWEEQRRGIRDGARRRVLCPTCSARMIPFWERSKHDNQD